MIRRSVVALIFMLACAAPAMAQISYGIKGGINVADLAFDGEGEVPSSGRIGVLAGGFATIPLSGWLAAQPEVTYTVKGASLDVADVESDFIVDYLEVPLLARIRIRRNVYAAVGPTLAYRLRARSRTSFGESTEEIDAKDDVEDFDLGVVASGGVQYGRWVFDGRYTHGLSDIDADSSDDVKIRNRVFSLSAGFRF